MLRRQPIDADYGRFYAQEAGRAPSRPHRRWGLDYRHRPRRDVSGESRAGVAGGRGGPEDRGQNPGARRPPVQQLQHARRPHQERRQQGDHEAAKEDSDSEVQVDLSYTLTYQRDGQVQDHARARRHRVQGRQQHDALPRLRRLGAPLRPRGRREYRLPILPAHGYAAERGVTQTYDVRGDDDHRLRPHGRGARGHREHRRPHHDRRARRQSRQGWMGARS